MARHGKVRHGTARRAGPRRPGPTSSLVPAQEVKVLENRLRRTAARRGYRLEKSRLRDSRAIGYGGYMLVEIDRNVVVCGSQRYAYSATLDEIEAFLESL